MIELSRASRGRHRLHRPAPGREAARAALLRRGGRAAHRAPDDPQRRRARARPRRAQRPRARGGGPLTDRTYLSSPDVTQAEEDALVRALRSGWVAPLGPEVDAFEAELAEATGRSLAVALSSGTAALHLGLLHLGVGPGDVVVTSSMTFAATANAITYTGATPVFVDSDETRQPRPRPGREGDRRPARLRRATSPRSSRSTCWARWPTTPASARWPRATAYPCSWTPPSRSARAATDAPPAPTASRRSCPSTATRS